MESDVQHAGIGGMIRARRQKLDLTLQEVSSEAGISTGYLSLIERDKVTPALTTLSRIAAALGVGIDAFVGRPEPADCVTRADSRSEFPLGGLRYERLGAVFPGSELSCFKLTLEPGYASEASGHTGEETIFVLSGRVELLLDGEAIGLSTGDSAHYDSNRAHGLRNDGDAPAELLWTGTIDLFGDRMLEERAE